MADEPDGTQRRRLTLSERLLGTGERIGLWTLPMFLIVGLAGAVLAGTVAVVWYSQQVTALRDEIREARDELSGAVERVQEAGDEALAAIGGEVDAVQEALTRNLPIESADEVGLVLVRARLPQSSGGGSGGAGSDGGSGGTGSGGQPSPSPTASPTASRRGPSLLLVQDAPQQESTDPEQEAPQPAPQPTTNDRVRVGSAFAVARDGTATFFVTAHAVVAEPSSPGGVLETVEVVLPSGPVIASVHAWDDGRDVALLRAEAGSVTIAPWRPRDNPLAPGERVVAAGLTSAGDLLRISGTVGFNDLAVLVDDLDTPATVTGGPIVDLDGRIVAIRSTAYRPLDGLVSDVPVHLLCERLLRNCEANEAAGGDDGEAGEGGEDG